MEPGKARHSVRRRFGMDDILRDLEDLNTATLSEAASLMDESEERAEELAEQGLVRAFEGPDGWRFDKTSAIAYQSEKIVGTAVRSARDHSEELARLVEVMARSQYARGQVVGELDMGRQIAERLNEVLKSLSARSSNRCPMSSRP